MLSMFFYCEAGILDVINKFKGPRVCMISESNCIGNLLIRILCHVFIVLQMLYIGRSRAEKSLGAPVAYVTPLH